MKKTLPIFLVLLSISLSAQNVPFEIEVYINQKKKINKVEIVGRYWDSLQAKDSFVAFTNKDSNMFVCSHEAYKFKELIIIYKSDTCFLEPGAIYSLRNYGKLYIETKLFSKKRIFYMRNSNRFNYHLLFKNFIYMRSSGCGLYFKWFRKGKK